MAVYSKDIVIYGSGLGAFAAAVTAAKLAPSKTICIVAPSHCDMFGGLATEGGQNYWDIDHYNKTSEDDYITKGSFSKIIQNVGFGYNTFTLSNYLRNELKKYSNIVLFLQCDFVSYTTSYNPFVINSITIKNQKTRPILFRWVYETERKLQLKMLPELESIPSF